MISIIVFCSVVMNMTFPGFLSVVFLFLSVGSLIFKPFRSLFSFSSTVYYSNIYIFLFRFISLYCFTEIIICMIHPETHKDVYKLLGFYLLTDSKSEQMKLSIYLYCCIGIIFSWKCVHNVELDPNAEIKRIRLSVLYYYFIIIIKIVKIIILGNSLFLFYN